MSKYILRSIDPLSAARTYSLVAGSVAIIMGILKLGYSYYLFATRDVQLTIGEFFSRTLGEIAASLVTALVVGVLLGLIVSWFYNFWAKHLGGVKIDLDDQR